MEDGVNVKPHHTGFFLQDSVHELQWFVFVNSPEKRQGDQPTCVPIMLKIREVELEEVSGDEREQHQLEDNI